MTPVNAPAPIRATQLNDFRSSLKEVKMPEERRAGVDTATEIMRLWFNGRPDLRASERMAKIRELANDIIEMTYSVDARLASHN